MSRQPKGIQKRLLSLLCWVLLGLLFAIMYRQWPLYTENQNTKFLFGAAASGYGTLADDWTANTIDPLPVFSALVEGLYRIGHIEWTYAIFALLLIVYVYALSGIARCIFPVQRNSVAPTIFLAVFFLAHRAGTTHSGLAMQYLLGTYLQPCVFGVFLLLSIYRFLKQDTLGATLLLAVAACFHPTYLPTALLLLGVYVGAAVWRKRATREGVGSAVVFVLLVASLVVRTLVLFSTTTPETGAQAMEILAYTRIPHHTMVQEWFNLESAIKIGWIALALILVRRTPLFWVIGALFSAILLSVPVMYVYPNAALAFMTPWRTSVVLVPLALTVSLGWIAVKLAPIFEARAVGRRLLQGSAVLLVSYTVVLGGIQQKAIFEWYQNTPEMSVIRFVRENATRGDLYLVPPYEAGFHRFRLETGVPILANWKTHPYKDVEVIEWHERITETDAFYAAANREEGCQQLLRMVDRYGLTHAIVSAEQGLDDCSGSAEIYRDGTYRVLELRTATATEN